MPRKGKGQQATKTVTGQQYGEAKAQEESQSVVALPQMEEPQMPTMRPGESAFARPTERPAEPIGTASAAIDTPSPEITMERRMKIVAMLPLLEASASEPHASPGLRNLVRRMKLMIGPVQDFQDKRI
tara:strand:+ start:196 stop:579 length:384 start_codon:yes stop_codon:yes gene_type:complete